MMVSIIQLFMRIMFLTYLMFSKNQNDEANRGFTSKIGANVGAGSKSLCSIPCLWSRDIIIHLWFFIFNFYEAIWMYFYLKDSQPWHYAIKWYNCNHFLMKWEAHKGKIICNRSSLLSKTHGKVVSFLIVCFICQTQFQPLWFAIKKISISLMDKAFDFHQGIFMGSSLKLLASNLTTRCASVNNILDT